MILLVGTPKGGPGKTTIAVNIAVALARCGRSTLLLDVDPQRSAAKWSDRRSVNPALVGVTCIEKGGNVYRAAADLAGRFDEVVIDAGGRDGGELRSAMLAANAMLIPCRPSQLDLEATAGISTLVAEANACRVDPLSPVIVLSQVSTHARGNERESAETYLRSACPDIAVMKARISERKAFRDALIDGRGVWEMDGAQAAGAELEALVAEIYK